MPCALTRPPRVRGFRATPRAHCATQDAKKYCDAEKTCQGFTFKDTTEPTLKLSVRFKSNSAVTYDPSWLSYTKTASPNPYFYQAGFLSDGKELHTGAMTLSDAQVRQTQALEVVRGCEEQRQLHHALVPFALLASVRVPGC